MKIPTPKYSKKKIIILIVVVIVLIAASLGTYLYAFKGKLFGWSPLPQEKSKINYDKPTEEQKKTGENSKKQTVIKEEAKPNTGGSDQAPSPTPQPNGKNKVGMMISAANQNGSVLQIRSMISAVTNSGTCTLTLTKSGQTVTKTAGVQALASDSTCQGFDIPTSELSPGNWQLALHFENSKLEADTSRTVIVQ
ncbi:MAG: hypothetical protein M3Q14_00385 [bacterium]|nr:hypothetical protein [bacterium]